MDRFKYALYLIDSKEKFKYFMFSVFQKLTKVFEIALKESLKINEKEKEFDNIKKIS